MITKAKPCPFCGGETITFKEGSTYRWIAARCDSCGATCGEVRVKTSGDATLEDWREQSELDALAEWNGRITP